MVEQVVPLSYERIEAQMRKMMNRLDILVTDFTNIVDDAATAEATFKVAFAKARIFARGSTVDGKRVTESAADDMATEETEDERLTYLVSEAKRDAGRQGINAARAQLEALRSLMASYRDPTGSN